VTRNAVDGGVTRGLPSQQSVSVTLTGHPGHPEQLFRLRVAIALACAGALFVVPTSAHARSSALSRGMRQALDAEDYPRVMRNLGRGASIRAVGTKGVTVVMVAAAQADHVLIRKAVRRGVKIDGRDAMGSTALMLAIENGDPETVRLLLSLGSNINGRDRRGRTALMWAAQWGRVAATRALIESGANLNLRDKEGLTAADLARRLTTGRRESEEVKNRKRVLEIIETRATTPK